MSEARKSRKLLISRLDRILANYNPYSAGLYSERQSAYTKRFGLDSVYTPQMVVDGTSEFVGGSSGLADKAFRKALGIPKLAVHLSSISADASNTLHAHLETGELDPSFGSREADVTRVVTLESDDLSIAAHKSYFFFLRRTR